MIVWSIEQSGTDTFSATYEVDQQIKEGEQTSNVKATYTVKVHVDADGDMVIVQNPTLIIEFLLPAVFSGWPPIASSIICAILSTAVTLLLLNGQSGKTFSAILSTMIGMFFALILFLITSAMIHVDGFSSADAEGLILIHEETGNTALRIHVTPPCAYMS